jgi:hypothetical protein
VTVVDEAARVDVSLRSQERTSFEILLSKRTIGLHVLFHVLVRAATEALKVANVAHEVIAEEFALEFGLSTMHGLQVNAVFFFALRFELVAKVTPESTGRVWLTQMQIHSLV